MADRTVSVKLQANVTDYMAKFSAAGKAAGDLAAKVEKASGRSREGMQMLGRAGVVAGGVIVGGFVLAAKTAAEFDAKMANTSALLRSSFDNAKNPAAALATAMGQLRTAALTVGQAYGYTANQVADAEAELVKAGVSVKDIMGGALVGALTLASAGQTDVATATEIAATAMTQFQLAGKDVPHIADLLAAGADKALGGVVDLGYALDQAGPQAHMFGVSLEETVGTLAAFANAGQIGERGGTVLSQVLLKLASPGKEASDIIQQLGIDIYSANGQFVGMARLAGELQTKMGGLTQAERTHDLSVIFGARAIRGANILYQEGAKGIGDWTKRVNDQGFAAAQAAGKLDSLSGDLTKLKAAAQSAFIGIGESGQGPLRSMTQDLTNVIQMWNDLPGPVKTASEVLIAAGGAAVLAGGAFIMLVPKIAATKAAMEEMSLSTAGMRRGMSSTAGFLAGPWGLAITAATVGLGLWASHASQAKAQMDALTSAVEADSNALGKNTRQAVVNRLQQDGLLQMAKQAGLSLSTVTDAALGNAAALRLVDEASAHQVTQLGAHAAATGVLSRSVHDLAGQVHGAQQAAQDHAAAMKAEGGAANGAKGAVNGLSGAAAGAAKQTETATAAAKAYNDALHALADPLFGMNQALQDLASKQAAANKAVHQYGADSKKAKQANLDLASSVLDVQAAADTLAASVKDGSTTIGAAKNQLQQWVAAGLITKAQADSITSSFDKLINRANTLGGKNVRVNVTANTAVLDRIDAWLASHHGVTIPLTVQPSGQVIPHGLATGGPITGPGSGTSDSIPAMLSNGEFVIRSDGSNLADALRFFGAPGFASGGPVDTSAVIRSVMSGTMAPSIDRLSRALQHAIASLSNVVQRAEAYRSQIRSNLQGYAGLSNMTAGTDSMGSSFGRPNVNSYLADRANKLKQFAHLLRRLDREGLDRDLLAQFAQIGPDAIPAMQQLVGTGKHGVRRANRLESTITRYAGSTATFAANDRYAAQIAHGVNQLPDRFTRSMVRALRHAHFAVHITEIDRRNGKRVVVAA